ncbi:MAG TPA: hypothetical protein VLT36_06015 [Candidatus Dormibacteraeota bacterium]|nr:hypothetical protein [Candidatus Dormibacteraeota bacterium]
MDKRHDYYSPVTEGLSEFAKDALSYKPESDPDEPRDALWLRWLKFSSVIILPALVVGLGFVFEDYVMHSNSTTAYQRSRAEKRVQRDSVGAMKIRFLVGSGIGGSLGLIYVVRCIVRKVDP